MNVAVSNQVLSLARGLSMSQSRLAEIVGASPRSVSRWAGGHAAPHSRARRRLLELTAVVDALKGVIRDEDIGLWMSSPHPKLAFDTPEERVSQGKFKDVIAVIEALADGVFS